MDLTLEYRLAIQAAIEASFAIREVYANGHQAFQKEDGSPVTEADLKASKIINTVLSASGCPIIDEETDKIPFEKRQRWTRCWCVDPLDGTKEFIKRNGEFAVNIALIEDGKAVLGVIASPMARPLLLGDQQLECNIQPFQNFCMEKNQPPFIEMFQGTEYA